MTAAMSLLSRDLQLCWRGVDMNCPRDRNTKERVVNGAQTCADVEEDGVACSFGLKRLAQSIDQHPRSLVGTAPPEPRQSFPR